MTPDEMADLRAAMRETASDLLAYFERRSPLAREDAADMLGETMLQAWRRTDTAPVGDRSRQRMWLFGIAARVLANQRRSTRRRSALAARLREQLAVDAPAPDPPQVHAVRDAVLRLPQKHRELVILVHWDGFSLVEAAKIIGLNQSTARSRYAAARLALKHSLGELADGDDSAAFQATDRKTAGSSLTAFGGRTPAAEGRGTAPIAPRCAEVTAEP